MRTLFAALILSSISLPAFAEGIRPRAAYVCEALISARSPGATIDDRDHLLKRFGRSVNEIVQKMTLQRRLSLATIRDRIATDLGRADDGRFTVKQELRGREEIAAYFERVDGRSRDLEASHVAADAKTPYAIKPYLLKDAGMALTALAVSGTWGYLTKELLHAHHPILAAGFAYLTVSSFVRGVIPFVANVVRDITNVLVLKAHREGRTPRYAPSTAEIFDDTFDEFRRQVLEGKDEVIWATSRVALPLSRSAASFWLSTRETPTAADIEAAVRRSGDFRLPADPRAMVIDHLYFFDLTLNEPVLITLMREGPSF